MYTKELTNDVTAAILADCSLSAGSAVPGKDTDTVYTYASTNANENGHISAAAAMTSEHAVFPVSVVQGTAISLTHIHTNVLDINVNMGGFETVPICPLSSSPSTSSFPSSCTVLPSSCPYPAHYASLTEGYSAVDLGNLDRGMEGGGLKNPAVLGAEVVDLQNYLQALPTRNEMEAFVQCLELGYPQGA